MVAGVVDFQVLSAVDGQVLLTVDGPIPYLVDGAMVVLPVGKILITRTAKHMDIIVNDRWYFLLLFLSFIIINSQREERDVGGSQMSFKPHIDFYSYNHEDIYFYLFY